MKMCGLLPSASLTLSNLRGCCFNRYMRPLIFLFCVYLYPSLALSEAAAPGATHFEYGFFCAVETVDTQEAKDTISGVVNLIEGPPPFLKKTTIIPGQLGIGFGIHVTVNPNFVGQATVVTVHPPMGPDKVIKETWQSDYQLDDINYNGFTFEYDYELVFGDWSISAHQDGREIYSVDFQVVDPRFLPPVSCDGGLLS